MDEPNAPKSGSTDGDFTLDERVARIESILAQFDHTPPPLSADDAFRQTVKNLGAEVDAVRRLMKNYDGFADVVVQLAARVKQLEHPAAPVIAERDPDHETRTMTRVFKCSVCGSESTDVVKTSESSAQEKPCGVCGRIAVIDRTFEDAKGKRAHDIAQARANAMNVATDPNATDAERERAQRLITSIDVLDNVPDAE